MTDEARDLGYLDEFVIQRGAIQTLVDMEDAIGNVLGENGCDCECGHGWEDHEPECERCLACRVSEPLMGASGTIAALKDAADAAPSNTRPPLAFVLVGRNELSRLYGLVGGDLIDAWRTHIEGMLEKYGDGLDGITIVRPEALRALLDYAENFGGTHSQESQRWARMLNEQLQAFDA